MSGDPHADYDHPKIQKLRELCLSLPQASEKITWGHPTFRVKDKIFCACGIGEKGPVATFKCEPHEKARLLELPPYYRPAYVDKKGWLGVRLGARQKWGVVADLVVQSYRMIAPKTLVKELDGTGK